MAELNFLELADVVRAHRGRIQRGSVKALFTGQIRSNFIVGPVWNCGHRSFCRSDLLFIEFIHEFMRHTMDTIAADVECREHNGAQDHNAGDEAELTATFVFAANSRAESAARTNEQCHNPPRPAG